MSFENEVESRHKEMIDELESITVENLKSEGVSLSFGGKTFKFTDLEILEDESVEEKLRKEFKEKLNDQQQKIREKINSKISQLVMMHQTKQQEMDRKEKALRRKYAQASMMPEITEKHMLKNLSVYKGNANDELVWAYRCYYNPKILIHIKEDGYNKTKHRKAIPPDLVGRMKKPIVITINTKGSSITSVVTNIPTTDGRTLEGFPHYHQTGHSDCWGSWQHPQSWNTPDDIIRCGKDAEAVLETINQGSIAKKGPNGLPRLKTIVDACKRLPDVDSVRRKKNKDDAFRVDDDVWST